MSLGIFIAFLLVFLVSFALLFIEGTRKIEPERKQVIESNLLLISNGETSSLSENMSVFVTKDTISYKINDSLYSIKYPTVSFNKTTNSFDWQTNHPIVVILLCLLLALVLSAVIFCAFLTLLFIGLFVYSLCETIHDCCIKKRQNNTHNFDISKRRYK